jgi:iron complex transport system ATP-binding protein
MRNRRIAPFTMLNNPAERPTPSAPLAAIGVRRAVSAHGGAVGPLDLAARPGELLGVLGPNGAGKTTLLRALAGLLPLDAGEVRLHDRPLGQWDGRARARALGYVPQREPTPDGWSVRAWVSQSRAPHTGWTGALRVSDERAVTAALEQWDLVPLAGREVSSLSGGELRRCALARAFAQGAGVLLLDEPLAALDLGQQVACCRRLRAWVAAGGAAVAVLHDLTAAARWCDRVALLRDGALVAVGPPAEVLTAELVGAAFGVRVRVTVDPATGTAVVVPTGEDA